jgi:hypothetical protein
VNACDRRRLERIPNKLTGLLDQNALQLFDLRDFLSIERFRSTDKRARGATAMNASSMTLSSEFIMQGLEAFSKVQSTNMKTQLTDPSFALPTGWSASYRTRLSTCSESAWTRQIFIPSRGYRHFLMLS